jgi:Tfp pilus assembly protein PilF
LKERFKEAEEVYQAGIKNCPDSSDLHNNYGVFLVDSGKRNQREPILLGLGSAFCQVKWQ